MKICYVSCGANGAFGLPALLEAGHEIVSVVSIPPELGKKYQVSGYFDFAPLCRKHDLNLHVLKDYTLRQSDIAALQADVLVVNGWNRLISEDILSAFPLGGIGLHAGHPPIGQGRAPLVWNILLGWKDLVVFAFRLTPRADDGNILAQATINIAPTDDVGLLYEKTMFVGARLIVEAVGLLADGESGVPQDNLNAAHYAARTPEDGWIDFSQTTVELFDFIRAQTRPYPGAFTMLEGHKITVWRAAPCEVGLNPSDYATGEVAAALPSGPIVKTGDGFIWLLELETAEPLPESLVGRVLASRPE